MQLKILSWNIWTDGYFDQTLKFLKAFGADIIGLQEVQADNPKRDVIGFLKKLGYGHVFAPVEKDWGDRVVADGPAVFCKHKIIKSGTTILSKEDPRAVAWADIVAGGEVLHVFGTHLVHTHQKPSGVQEEQARNLLGMIPNEKSIAIGDFNAEPESGAIKILESRLVNADSNLHPTWSVYPEGCAVCKPQNVSIKLDYIFATADIKTTDFRVEKSRASDHLPISVVVKV